MSAAQGSNLCKHHATNNRSPADPDGNNDKGLAALAGARSKAANTISGCHSCEGETSVGKALNASHPFTPGNQISRICDNIELRKYSPEASGITSAKSYLRCRKNTPCRTDERGSPPGRGPSGSSTAVQNRARNAKHNPEIQHISQTHGVGHGARHSPPVKARGLFLPGRYTTLGLSFHATSISFYTAFRIHLLLRGKCHRSRRRHPKDVLVGIYVTNLFNIDFSKGDVDAQFWVWFDHSVAEFDTRNDIEIINARSTKQITHSRSDVDGHGFWDATKYSTTLKQRWSISNYPFDRQTIKIGLESTVQDSRELRFVPDLKGTKISEDLQLEGWTVEDLRLIPSEVTYKTAYGDPTLSPDGPSRFPKVTVEIDIKRHGWRLLFNMFVGFVLAISLAGIVLTSLAFERLSSVIEMGPQLSLGTGALFSIIGAGYILQNGLPPTSEFSLADAFQLTAFFVTFMTMLSVFVVHVLKRHDKPKAALTYGRICFGVYLAILTLIAFRVGSAITS